jgi:hypothetical protein
MPDPQSPDPDRQLNGSNGHQPGRGDDAWGWVPPSPLTQVSRPRPIGGFAGQPVATWAALAAAVVGAFACLLPWATSGLASVNGLHGEGLWAFVALLVGAAALVLSMASPIGPGVDLVARVMACLAGLAATALTASVLVGILNDDAIDVLGGQLEAVDPALGVFLSLACAAVFTLLSAAALLAPRR